MFHITVIGDTNRKVNDDNCLTPPYRERCSRKSCHIFWVSYRTAPQYGKINKHVYPLAHNRSQQSHMEPIQKLTIHLKFTEIADGLTHTRIATEHVRIPITALGKRSVHTALLYRATTFSIYHPLKCKGKCPYHTHTATSKDNGF